MTNTGNLRILGCSGGISSNLRTTSLLLNESILIDAGTGVGDLTLDELRKIDHVFLTHSHLDHICSIPFIADAIGASRDKPLKIYGINETIHALQKYIFNDVIWPDFTKIPSAQNPFVSLSTIEIGAPIQLGNISIIALPVDHSIAANAYAVKSNTGALVFSGDTGSSNQFWDAINRTIPLKNLRHLIIETSFLNTEERLASISGHLSPKLLIQELGKLDSEVAHPDLQIWISHLKPDGGEDIMTEISHEALSLRIKPRILTRGMELQF
jgi:cAMP phosphodiesterase